jgi:hypothetical protein
MFCGIQKGCHFYFSAAIFLPKSDGLIEFEDPAGQRQKYRVKKIIRRIKLPQGKNVHPWKLKAACRSA